MSGSWRFPKTRYEFIFVILHLPNAFPFQVETIKKIGYWHDKCYKSVNFGEDLIKEMLFSSVCGVPLSVQSAMTAYRLMIQRVNRVATGFDPFASLSMRSRSILLRHNADLVVSLRGAVFFETNKQGEDFQFQPSFTDYIKSILGLDQIVISLGINDCDFARKLILDAKQQRINKIQYTSMNALQKIEHSSPSEMRYNKLLERVGTTMTVDVNLIKLLSYVLLFLCDFEEELEDQGDVVQCQETMIRMLQRYIFGKYPRRVAAHLFSKVLHCVTDLQELTWIKKQRQMATDTNHLIEEQVMPTAANKPKNQPQLPADRLPSAGAEGTQNGDQNDDHEDNEQTNRDGNE